MTDLRRRSARSLLRKRSKSYCKTWCAPAVDEASRRVDEELADQLKSLTGGIPGMAGLKIPGLF